MTTLENIPEDIINIIANCLCQFECDRNQIHVVRDASACATVGHPYFRKIADIMWDTLSPGCVQRAENQFAEMKKVTNLKQQQHLGDPPSMPTDITSSSNIISLIAKCNELKCRRRTGTKAQLWRAIEDTVNKSFMAYNNHMYEKLKDKPKRRTSCPLNESERLNIIKFYNQRICASKAKNVYKLTERDLNGLECEHICNPHYRSAAPMRLYRLRDVIDISKAQIPKIPKTTRTTTRTTKKTQPNNSTTRRVKLIQALENRGIELRDDSRLCNDYIKCDKGAIEEIVEVMVEMDFFHKYTNYANMRSQNMTTMMQQALEYEGYLSKQDIEEIGYMASKKAQQTAFSLWLQSFVSKEDALKTPIIPPRYAAQLVANVFVNA